MNGAANSVAPAVWGWDLVLLVGLVCVAGSAFFSGSETGLMSVSRARLSHLMRRGRARRGKALALLLERLEDSILTCLIGTNLCNVIFSGVMTVALTTRFGPRGEPLAALTVAITLIVWGEILPKVLYREYPERLTLASVPLIRAAMLALAPVRWLMSLYSGLWRRLLPDAAGGSGGRLDRRGMATLLLAHSQPQVQDRQFRRSLRRFLALANLDLTRIMQPADRLVTIPPEATVADCLATAGRSGFSRFPVQHRDGGDLVGWILVRDLLLLARPQAAGDPVPASLLRSPLLVDVGMSPYELFAELGGQGQQLAFVVDRQGRTIGMVTLEDLIETVVGSIQDEFDPPDLARAV